jgi:hypothetical protein
VEDSAPVVVKKTNNIYQDKINQIIWSRKHVLVQGRMLRST